MTQGRQLIAHLRKKPRTYLEMNLLGISTSPHKRVLEALKDDEVLVKGKRYLGEGRYLTTWSVKGATRWTA